MSDTLCIPYDNKKFIEIFLEALIILFHVRYQDTQTLKNYDNF